MSIDFAESLGYENADFRWTSVVTDDVAAVQVTLELDDNIYGHAATFVATGSSKRHPTDPADPVVGEALAVSRALAALSEQLNTYTEIKISEIQDEKELQKAAAVRLKKARNAASTTIINIPAGAGLDR